MVYEYKNEHEITYSEVDINLNLSIVSSMNLAEDMMTKYFQIIKTGNDTNKIKHNAIWVLTKTRLHFIKYPRLFEKIKCICNTTISKAIRIGLESVFYNEKDEKIFIISQECCPIDFNTRKIRKINTISFPADLQATKQNLLDPFSKFNSNFEKYVLKKNIIVQPIDIDFSNHTNNVSYIKYIMNIFENEFWKDKIITDLEIHFINESIENDELSIYKFNTNDNNIDILIKNKQKVISQAKIKYKTIV